MLVLDARSKQSTVPMRSTQLAASEYLPEDVELRHHKIKSEVRKGNVEHIIRLVADRAEHFHSKLPAHVQVWLPKEDLIAEGIGFATTTAIKTHKISKGAGYVTHLWNCLDNLYKDKLKAIYADKRFVKIVYSADSWMVHTKNGDDVSLYDFLCRRSDRFSITEDRIIKRIDAERAFLKLYARSSPQLRRYLIMWVIQPRNTKLKKYGQKFLDAKKELHKFCPTPSIGCGPNSALSIEHCQTIWRDAECRKNICVRLARYVQTGSLETAIQADTIYKMVAGIATLPSL